MDIPLPEEDDWSVDTFDGYIDGESEDEDGVGDGCNDGNGHDSENGGDGQDSGVSLASRLPARHGKQIHCFQLLSLMPCLKLLLSRPISFPNSLLTVMT